MTIAGWRSTKAGSGLLPAFGWRARKRNCSTWQFFLVGEGRAWHLVCSSTFFKRRPRKEQKRCFWKSGTPIGPPGFSMNAMDLSCTAAVPGTTRHRPPMLFSCVASFGIPVIPPPSETQHPVRNILFFNRIAHSCNAAPFLPLIGLNLLWEGARVSSVLPYVRRCFARWRRTFRK